MALRGRGTSSAPPQTVEAVADQAGVEIAGDEESLPHAAYRLVSAAADDVTRASPA
jgi:hypothetical protein